MTTGVKRPAQAYSVRGLLFKPKHWQVPPHYFKLGRVRVPAPMLHMVS